MIEAWNKPPWEWPGGPCMGLTEGTVVRARIEIRETGITADKFPEPHAEKDDFGTVIHWHEGVWPTVRFWNSGTATIVGPEEVEALTARSVVLAIIGKLQHEPYSRNPAHANFDDDTDGLAHIECSLCECLRPAGAPFVQVMIATLTEVVRQVEIEPGDTLYSLLADVLKAAP